jgi:hypothetical protein
MQLRYFREIARLGGKTAQTFANVRSAAALETSCNRQPLIYNPQSLRGGIAQLVERQLCKLEVRGSNPLASSLRSQR